MFNHCSDMIAPLGNHPFSGPTVRRGAATVEFAVVAIVLFILVLGGIEMTRVSMLRHTVDHAAYVAARDAIIPGADAAEVIATAEDHLRTIGLSGATVTVTPAVILDETSVVEVQIDLPISQNSLMTPEYLFGDLIGRSALITERAPVQMSASLPEPPPPPPPTTPIEFPTGPVPSFPTSPTPLPTVPDTSDGPGPTPPPSTPAPAPPSPPPPPPPPPPPML